ncbi:30S ribosomal protein S9 [Candidatus Uhrbacteria bacterium RIFOXYB12_FULL_58_10]|uniref:Small ribosomal subunit protein uS9 n=1 Tax=Candidatus Uhrbacteria bacterium RIFOXYB2_FULL_57_15 TaxID=1802422 RepID=A0A1F7W6T5_9BACT|nr:MAG: 30S ribosomal protein S9 [Candidatus Uhrbacteria bacterium RIFOXYB12_FULL_58_10]OGL98502.1 MAG: 30S ribosomal protein S9 [Candidatus Uhrbacteria bacterium RIFOXYB2_FULL_57_15]OGL99183.1 MAG: 30S ribosomal protein S9 [Candidatus Uhrbacteria bacterium RIFOXYC12_FULL_57_11]
MTETTTKYIKGLGRRKEASAQVRLIPGGTGKIEINGREMAEYFPLFTLQQSVNAPLIATGNEGKFDVSVRVSGGGIRGQADAVRLGIARALIDLNPDYRPALKKLGYLSRDARIRERKKYGHLGARRSPQWAKR